MPGGPTPQSSANPMMQHANVAGGPLRQFVPKTQYITGYYGDGYCRTSFNDGQNTSIAASLTQPFLDYTSKQGNDLSAKGAAAGMKWCIEASRWQEAYKAFQDGSLGKDGVPQVHLAQTDRAALDVVSYKDLKSWAAPAEAVESGRQSSAHATESDKSIVKESQEIGSAQPTEAPGAGKMQNSNGSQSDTAGQRG